MYCRSLWTKRDLNVPQKCSARGVRKVTSGMTGLWQPSVQVCALHLWPLSMAPPRLWVRRLERRWLVGGSSVARRAVETVIFHIKMTNKYCKALRRRQIRAKSAQTDRNPGSWNSLAPPAKSRAPRMYIHIYIYIYAHSPAPSGRRRCRVRRIFATHSRKWYTNNQIKSNSYSNTNSNSNILVIAIVIVTVTAIVNSIYIYIYMYIYIYINILALF